MKVFSIWAYFLAITLVAHAADQDQDSNNGKKKARHGATTTAEEKKASDSVQPSTKGKVQAKQHGTAQKKNVPSVQPSSKGKLQTTQEGATTVQKENVPARQASANGGVQNKPHGATTVQNKNVPAGQANTKGKVKIKQFSLSNSPNSRIESAQFRKDYRIQGSETWKGQHYVAFKNYRGTWHDQPWWNNHYNRIVLISGGWYFWSAGYWYPAWGYNPAVAYYPYNGPIYAYNNLPPDQVIANVQATLQTRGYYQGEVDGLLGPITRSALGNYQRDNSLYATEAIDEPTLDSLGMS